MNTWWEGGGLVALFQTFNCPLTMRLVSKKQLIVRSYHESQGELRVFSMSSYRAHHLTVVRHCLAFPRGFSKLVGPARPLKRHFLGAFTARNRTACCNQLPKGKRCSGGNYLEGRGRGSKDTVVFRPVPRSAPITRFSSLRFVGVACIILWEIWSLPNTEFL